MSAVRLALTGLIAAATAPGHPPTEPTPGPTGIPLHVWVGRQRFLHPSPGRDALSIRVTKNDFALLQTLWPGDRIDVYGTIDAHTDERQPVGTWAIRGLRLLAIGLVEESPQYRHKCSMDMVTVEVTPDQALAIRQMAIEGARLSFGRVNDPDAMSGG